MYVGLKQPRGDGERYVTPARAAAKETRSFTVLFKSCIFMVNINLNKTILQSIYIIFRLFLLFACLKKFERLNQNINSRRFIQFLDDLQTINHLLETINHVLEKYEYENSYSKQN